VQGFDVAVGLRSARVDARVPGLQVLERAGEVRAAELVAGVAENALQASASGLQIARDATGELRGLRGGGVALFADHQLGPRERGGDIDRSQLPDRAVRAPEPPDVETVDPDELARPVDVDVLLGTRVVGGS
jgi:hypothetical protein